MRKKFNYTNKKQEFKTMEENKKIEALYPPPYKQILDAAEMLWVVLANVSGGDWSKQTKEWQKAAAKCRDNYFEVIRSLSRPPEIKESSENKVIELITKNLELIVKKLEQLEIQFEKLEARINTRPRGFFIPPNTF